jgi:hypothetical protein
MRSARAVQTYLPLGPFEHVQTSWVEEAAQKSKLWLATRPRASVFHPAAANVCHRGASGGAQLCLPLLIAAQCIVGEHEDWQKCQFIHLRADQFRLFYKNGALSRQLGRT